MVAYVRTHVALLFLALAGADGPSCLFFLLALAVFLVQ